MSKNFDSLLNSFFLSWSLKFKLNKNTEENLSVFLLFKIETKWLALYIVQIVVVLHFSRVSTMRTIYRKIALLHRSKSMCALYFKIKLKIDICCSATSTDHFKCMKKFFQFSPIFERISGRFSWISWDFRQNSRIKS